MRQRTHENYFSIIETCYVEVVATSMWSYSCKANNLSILPIGLKDCYIGALVALEIAINVYRSKRLQRRITSTVNNILDDGSVLCARSFPQLRLLQIASLWNCDENCVENIKKLFTLPIAFLKWPDATLVSHPESTGNVNSSGRLLQPIFQNHCFG